MAIRFLCNNCQQPIEIDDEWASKQVACPFCRKTISAPAESTLVETQPVPVASPVRSFDALGEESAAQGQVAALRPGSNRLAIVAFALGCCTMGMLAGHVGFQYVHSADVIEFAKEIQSLEASSESRFDAMMKYTHMHGDSLPSWLLILGMLDVVLLASCLGTVICGLIAIRRPAGRRLAWASLAMSGLVPIVMCCGGGAA